MSILGENVICHFEDYTRTPVYSRPFHHTPGGQTDLTSGEFPNIQSVDTKGLSVLAWNWNGSTGPIVVQIQTHVLGGCIALSANSYFKARACTGRKTKAPFPIFQTDKSSLPRWKANFCTNFKKGPTKAKCPHLHIFLLCSSRKDFILLPASPLNLLDKVLLL